MNVMQMIKMDNLIIQLKDIEMLLDDEYVYIGDLIEDIRKILRRNIKK